MYGHEKKIGNQSQIGEQIQDNHPKTCDGINNKVKKTKKADFNEKNFFTLKKNQNDNTTAPLHGKTQTTPSIKDETKNKELSGGNEQNILPNFTQKAYLRLWEEWKQIPKIRDLENHLNDESFASLFYSRYMDAVNNFPLKTVKINKHSDLHRQLIHENDDQSSTHHGSIKINNNKTTIKTEGNKIIVTGKNSEGESVTTHTFKYDVTPEEYHNPSISSLRHNTMSNHFAARKIDELGVKANFTVDNNGEAQIQFHAAKKLKPYTVKERFKASQYNPNQFMIIDGDIVHVCDYDSDSNKLNKTSRKLSQLVSYAELGPHNLLLVSHVTSKSPNTDKVFVYDLSDENSKGIELKGHLYESGPKPFYGRYIVTSDHSYTMHPNGTSSEKVKDNGPIPRETTLGIDTEDYPFCKPRFHLYNDGEHIFVNGDSKERNPATMLYALGDLPQTKKSDENDAHTINNPGKLTFDEWNQYSSWLEPGRQDPFTSEYWRGHNTHIATIQKTKDDVECYYKLLPDLDKIAKSSHSPLAQRGPSDATSHIGLQGQIEEQIKDITIDPNQGKTQSNVARKNEIYDKKFLSEKEQNMTHEELIKLNEKFKDMNFTQETYKEMWENWNNIPEFFELGKHLDSNIFPLLFYRCYTKITNSYKMKAIKIDKNSKLSDDLNEEHQKHRYLQADIDTRRYRNKIIDNRDIDETITINKGKTEVLSLKGNEIKVIGKNSKGEPGIIQTFKHFPTTEEDKNDNISSLNKPCVVGNKLPDSGLIPIFIAAPGSPRIRFESSDIPEYPVRQLRTSQNNPDQFTILDGDTVHICTYDINSDQFNKTSRKFDHLVNYAEMGPDNLLLVSHVTSKSPETDELFVYDLSDANSAGTKIEGHIHSTWRSHVYGDYILTRDNVYRMRPDGRDGKKVEFFSQIPRESTFSIEQQHSGYWCSPHNDGLHVFVNGDSKPGIPSTNMYSLESLPQMKQSHGGDVHTIDNPGILKFEGKENDQPLDEYSWEGHSTRPDIIIGVGKGFFQLVPDLDGLPISGEPKLSKRALPDATSDTPQQNKRSLLAASER